MITDKNVSDYIDSLYSNTDDRLEALRQEAENENIPIIRRQSEGFIKSLLLLKKPENILEIGSGVGYSAIFMAKTAPGAKITTIENYPPRIEAAKKNIESAGLKDRIKLIEGDASDVLGQLKGPFDFIFLDGPKGQYEAFLPELLRLLEGGGVLLCDNVLQGGDTARSRYAIERRERTIHERMRAFLYEITHIDELETSILSVGDGMSLSIKI